MLLDVEGNIAIFPLKSNNIHEARIAFMSYKEIGGIVT